MKVNGNLAFEDVIVFEVMDIDPGGKFSQPRVLIRHRLANELEEERWYGIKDKFRGQVNVELRV